MSSHQFRIRPAQFEDWPIIADFNIRLAAETEGKTLQQDIIEAGVQALLSDARHGRYFVAATSEAVIGQMMYTREWSDWRNGEIWWLQSVYVVPEYRNRGVFRMLYGHVEQMARESSDVVGLRLYVETQNSRAQAAYTQLGFHDAHYSVMERIFRNDV